jgi:uncharacterized membrane protein YGL010W
MIEIKREQYKESKLSLALRDYATSHRTLGNKRCHYVGIPFIVFSVFGLLSEVVFWRPGQGPAELLRVDGGVLLLIGVLLWIASLDFRFSVSFAPAMLASYFLGRVFSIGALIALMVVGWIFQAWGHAYYEKKSPAFFKNLKHLIIGPVFIFSDVTKFYDFDAGTSSSR